MSSESTIYNEHMQEKAALEEFTSWLREKKLAHDGTEVKSTIKHLNK